MKIHRAIVAGASLVAAAGLLLTACSSGSSASATVSPVEASSSTSVVATPAPTSSPQTSNSPAVSASTGSPVPTSSSSGSTAVKSTTADLKVGASKLGPVIADAKGFTVYYFTPDVANSGTSKCYAQCAKAWPPVLTTSSTPTATGVSGKVGTITRTDGTKQVTIAGRPIYTFAFDKAAGDINGQGSEKVWFAIHPTGTQIA